MMELMDGSLFDLLDESQNGSPFDLEEALEILHQIAKGMLYLHRNGFAHRDLKSLNILVKKIKGAQTHPSKGDFVVKLADFELVKLFDPTCSNLLTLTTKKVGTHVWRAPEVLMNNNGRVSPRRSDIYSFGMVCFEILSGEIPFKNCGLNSEELLNKIVHDGLRPTLSEDFPVELRTLIKSCWDADYARRPAFDEIYEQLLRAAVPFIQMCRKFVLHQAMSKEQSIDLRKRETSESVKDESKGSEAAAPAHRNLMKKAESLPTSLVKPPRTWIDMAMGVSRFKLDQSSEDQIKAKLLLQAETSLESTETEIINTWELMEGLDDQMAPQTRPATISSKSPDMEVLSKVSNQPALKLIPRSLSLSSLEGHRILNAGDVVSEVVNTYSTSAGFLNYSEDRDLDEEKCPLGGNHRVVLYLTSLGCIPKTFEDCCSLRAILESFSVWVDERDVSMHAEFRQELRELVDGLVIVPRVFIKGRYVGGLDEVRRLHEDGKLGELLQDLPMVHFRKPCDGCGGVRFVLCPKCRGSCWNITWYGAETVT